jgi:hypothetical protein
MKYGSIIHECGYKIILIVQVLHKVMVMQLTNNAYRAREVQHHALGVGTNFFPKKSTL